MEKKRGNNSAICLLKKRRVSLFKATISEGGRRSNQELQRRENIANGEGHLPLGSFIISKRRIGSVLPVALTQPQRRSSDMLYSLQETWEFPGMHYYMHWIFD